MFTTKHHHIRSIRHIAWIWFVLFALSPCIIKEAVFNVASVEYAKPLNKSRTTTPISSCSSPQSDSQQVSLVKQSKINNHTTPIDILANRHFVIPAVKIHHPYSRTFSGNSPPKYILYKRLKLGIA